VPSAFDLIAILLVLTAVFGWLNHVVIRLPHTIGLLVMALGASLILIGIEVALPDVALYENLTAMLRRVDFRETVLNGMLAFLLFAGALHVDLAILRMRAWTVGLIATQAPSTHGLMRPKGSTARSHHPAVRWRATPSS
jgi:monovalent cation:H+ antiporter, CPA1 family